MNLGMIATIGLVGLALLIGALLIYRRLPKKLKAERYAKKWKELQSYLKDKTAWPQALEDADKLLDTALKRRKFKGKSMGERLVSAQRIFSNNDNVWFAHNLYKKVTADPSLRLREADMKTALLGFRQALKDIGAIKTETRQPESDGGKK